MFNFNEVELPENNKNTESTFKVVKPGLQPMTVTNVVLIASSQKQTPGLEITLQDANGASFSENFWLSQKALARVQYLVKEITGEKLTGEYTSNEEVAAVVSAKIVGKTTPMVVDGENTTKEKDGKTYVNTYPTLRYMGFVNPTGSYADPIITDKTVAVAATTEDILNPTPAALDDDLPF